MPGGVCFGASGGLRDRWAVGDGSHAGELGLTVYTLLIAILACAVGFVLDQQFRDEDSGNDVNIVMRDAEMLHLEDKADFSRSRCVYY